MTKLEAHKFKMIIYDPFGAILVIVHQTKPIIDVWPVYDKSNKYEI